MMQRGLRLRRNADFVQLRERGRTVRGRGLMLSLAPNEQPSNRYGFITPKRLGKAVQRNRLRRRLRAATRVLHPHLRPGHDIAVIARSEAVTQPYALLLRNLAMLYRQAGLYEGDLP